MSGSCVLPGPYSELGESIRPPTTDSSGWFAVQTRYRFEKKVAAELNYRRCEVFLPLLSQRHQWSDRQKQVTIPLFPGYAFVRVDSSREARIRVLQTPGLINFVNFGGTLLSVPDKQIEDLQTLLNNKERFSLHPFVREGQRVRLRNGCLQGLEGIFLKQDKGKLLISIAAIERSLAIQIQGYDLEII